MAIDRDAAVEEMLMMGLRLVEGVARPGLEAAAGQDAEILFADTLAPLLEGGFLISTGSGSPPPRPAASASTRCWPLCSGEDPGSAPPSVPSV